MKQYKTLPLTTKLQIERDLKWQFGFKATAERNNVSRWIVTKIYNKMKAKQNSKNKNTI